jgi:hypothetical protein
MANTFELIQTVTLTGSQAAMDFTSIPSTYTDLCVKMSLRTDRSAIGDQIKFTVNGSTTTYSGIILLGYGTGVLSETSSAAGAGSGYLIGENMNAATSTSSTFGNAEIYLPNYAGSTNKSMSWDIVAENNASTGYQSLTAGLWSTTSAITSIKLQSANAANFIQYSTAYLYGIKNS